MRISYVVLSSLPQFVWSTSGLEEGKTGTLMRESISIILTSNNTAILSSKGNRIIPVLCTTWQ